MISGPTAGSFKHVAHMGYDAEKGFSSEGVDPSWTALLTSLEQSGMDKATIQDNMEFIKDYVRITIPLINLIRKDILFK